MSSNNKDDILFNTILTQLGDKDYTYDKSFPLILPQS